MTPIIEKVPHGSPKVAYLKGGDLRDHEDVGSVENQRKFLVYCIVPDVRVVTWLRRGCKQNVMMNQDLVERDVEGVLRGCC